MLFALVGFFSNSDSLALGATSLAESADKVAKDMPRGCIVTGEWQKGEVFYGISGPDNFTNIPPEKVVFEIGSISKVFTGLLLAQAVLEKNSRLKPP